MNITKTEILNQIQHYMNSAEFRKLEKRKPILAEHIKNCTADNLIIGDYPIVKEFRAHGRGSAMGSDSNNNKRTIVFNYTTKPFFYLIGQNESKEYVDHLMKLYGIKIFRTPNDARIYVESVGKDVGKSQLGDINFSLSNYAQRDLRLEELSQEMEIPYCTISIQGKDRKGKECMYLIGEWFETNSEESVLINPLNMAKAFKKKSKFGVIIGSILGSCIIIGMLLYLLL